MLLNLMKEQKRQIYRDTEQKANSRIIIMDTKKLEVNSIQNLVKSKRGIKCFHFFLVNFCLTRQSEISEEMNCRK